MSWVDGAGDIAHGGTARQRQKETRTIPPRSQLDEAGRGVSGGAGCPGYALLERGHGQENRQAGAASAPWVCGRRKWKTSLRLMAEGWEFWEWCPGRISTGSEHRMPAAHMHVEACTHTCAHTSSHMSSRSPPGPGGEDPGLWEDRAGQTSRNSDFSLSG